MGKHRTSNIEHRTSKGRLSPPRPKLPKPAASQFIDGSEEWEHVRPLCFQHVEEIIRPGGMIIVDDSWRYPELRKRNRAREVKTFQSTGPSRPGVTSTDVFSY